MRRSPNIPNGPAAQQARAAELRRRDARRTKAVLLRIEATAAIAEGWPEADGLAEAAAAFEMHLPAGEPALAEAVARRRDTAERLGQPQEAQRCAAWLRAARAAEHGSGAAAH